MALGKAAAVAFGAPRGYKAAMRVSLFEDSVPYDSQTPATRPLGGAARAVVGLAQAMHGAGHDVTVFNRLRRGHDADGIAWRPLDDPQAAVPADVALAVGRPSLLARLGSAGRRVFWAVGPAELLMRQRTRDLLAIYRPLLAFPAMTARAAWDGEPDVPACVVPPGIAEPYRFDLPIIPLAPVQAICTAHPLQGVAALIDLWRGRIRGAIADAELTLYSALLARGAAGEAVPDQIAPVLAAALQARDDGVTIAEPQPDHEMAFAYRDARAHLHPAGEADPYPFALADSQACGVPAVARRRGAAGCVIADGESGYLAPDDEAFANLAILMLDDENAFERTSAAARDAGRARQWTTAVAVLEEAAP